MDTLSRTLGLPEDTARCIVIATTEQLAWSRPPDLVCRVRVPLAARSILSR